jgi:aldo/keto reductase family protein
MTVVHNIERVHIAGTDRALASGPGRLEVGRDRRGRVDQDNPRCGRTRDQSDRHSAGLWIWPFRRDCRPRHRRPQSAFKRRYRHQNRARVGRWKVFRNARRDRILREATDSLRRLRTDYIDIYQVHWPDPLVPIEETAEAMQTRRARHTHLTITAGDLKCPRMPYFRLISA